MGRPLEGNRRVNYVIRRARTRRGVFTSGPLTQLQADAAILQLLLADGVTLLARLQPGQGHFFTMHLLLGSSVSGATLSSSAFQFRRLKPRQREVNPMSHVVQIKTRVQDPAAVTAARRRLGLAE